MQTLIPLRESYLTATEIIAYGQTLASLLAEMEQSESFLLRQRMAIVMLVERNAQLSGRVFSSEYTKQIKVCDEERDMLCSAAKREIENKAMLKSVFPEKAAAAEALLKVFDANSVDIHASYAVESLEIEQLLDILSTSANKAQLEVCDVLPIIEQLTSVQGTFTELYKKRLDAEAAKEFGNIRAVAKQMVLRIGYIHSHLDACATDLPDDYLSLADKVNELTLKTMTPARARRNRKEA
ncbi:MAG: hypothetical protein GY938_00585 [Ketobacter sp.]|nr:hypothetical protein [Ketobacter sp.]